MCGSTCAANSCCCTGGKQSPSGHSHQCRPHAPSHPAGVPGRGLGAVQRHCAVPCGHRRRGTDGPCAARARWELCGMTCAGPAAHKLRRGCGGGAAASDLAAVSTDRHQPPPPCAPTYPPPAVLVCCESYKFHERVQLDAITHNELMDQEQLAKVRGLRGRGTFKAGVGAGKRQCGRRCRRCTCRLCC